MYSLFPEQPMLPLTEVLKREHEEASTCHICMKPFDNPEKNWKVRDHCHYTGLYRGAAHNNCNLKYKIPKYIPLSFIISVGTMLTSSYDNLERSFRQRILE